MILVNALKKRILRSTRMCKPFSVDSKGSHSFSKSLKLASMALSPRPVVGLLFQLLGCRHSQSGSHVTSAPLPAAESRCVCNGVSVQYARGASITVGNNRIEVTKLPLWAFCRNLERYSDRQIIDMTGLTGTYTFVVQVMPEDYMAMMMRSAVLRDAKLPPEAPTLLDTSQPSTIGDALQQVGLKLERRRAPLDILVVDSALKTPTAN
jgi:uncharacterized protein (TIGR03435 family)